MSRIPAFLIIVLCLAACQKNNTPQATGGFSISVDTAVGSVSASKSPNTFLIHLRHPPQVAAVPIFLHIPAGGHPDQGSQVNDITWMDTVNISQNAVVNVNVTVNGQTTKYSIAYEYIFNNYWGNSLGRMTTNAMYFAGDTLYAATPNGLFYSTDNGVTFTIVSTLASAAALYQQADYVTGIYVSGTNMYSSVNSAFFISRDGGKTFAERDFDSTIGTSVVPNSIYGLFVQKDTLYVATSLGFRISKDKGNSFSNNITVGLGNYTYLRAVWATGDTVYVAGEGGLGISVDGGAHFVYHTNDLGVPYPDCFAVCGENGTICVGTLSGLSISTDHGSTFHAAGQSDGLIDMPVYAVAADKNLVCVGTNSGMFLSTDGGASFINFTPANGLGNFGIGSIAIHGSTIFIGCQHYYSPDVPGGMTIMIPRL